jgi:hypothetical protein
MSAQEGKRAHFDLALRRKAEHLIHLGLKPVENILV